MIRVQNLGLASIELRGRTLNRCSECFLWLFEGPSPEKSVSATCLVPEYWEAVIRAAMLESK